jgi:hypothetical protein
LYAKTCIIPIFFKDFYNIYKDGTYYYFFLKLISFDTKLYLFTLAGVDLLFFLIYQDNFFYK